MGDEEYKKLWAMIDDAHIRIGRLEGEREMLMRTIKELITATTGEDWEMRHAIYRATQLLETMKGE